MVTLKSNYNKGLIVIELSALIVFPNANDFLFSVLVSSDESILKCCLSFLNCDSFFQTLWPWHQLLAIAPNLSNEAKWLSVECLGRVSNWSETKREQLFRQLLSGENNFDALALNYFLAKNQKDELSTSTSELSFSNVVTRTVDVHGRHLIKDVVTEDDDDEEMVVQNDRLKFVNVQSRVPGT